MNDLHTILAALRNQLNEKHPARSTDWLEGLSLTNIQETINKAARDFPFTLPDSLLTLLSWSNGYPHFNFCGTFFEGLHDYTIASPKFAVPETGWRVLDVSYFVSLSLFSTGDAAGYIIPLPIEQSKDVPVIYVDYKDDQFEAVFSSLENMFKVILECEKRNLPSPSPKSRNIEALKIAAEIEPSYWKQRLENM